MSSRRSTNAWRNGRNVLKYLDNKYSNIIYSYYTNELWGDNMVTDKAGKIFEDRRKADRRKKTIKVVEDRRKADRRADNKTK